jgi:hypothetical protein
MVTIQHFADCPFWHPIYAILAHENSPSHCHHPNTTSKCYAISSNGKFPIDCPLNDADNNEVRSHGDNGEAILRWKPFYK